LRFPIQGKDTLQIRSLGNFYGVNIPDSINFKANRSREWVSKTPYEGIEYGLSDGSKEVWGKVRIVVVLPDQMPPPPPTDGPKVVDGNGKNSGLIITPPPTGNGSVEVPGAGSGCKFDSQKRGEFCDAFKDWKNQKFNTEHPSYDKMNSLVANAQIEGKLEVIAKNCRCPGSK